MSADPATISASEEATPARAGDDAARPQQPCAACGAPMAEDQEWCLECGAARTLIHPPPDWRAGVAIVLGVIALVAIVVIIVWP
ncbi:MAG: hypothetical protein ACJ764_04075 [Solirubrobacteraceae bacterium]